MSTRDAQVLESITFSIDGRIRVLDKQSIAQAFGIPLEMPKGEGFKK